MAWKRLMHHGAEIKSQGNKLHAKLPHGHDAFAAGDQLIMMASTAVNERSGPRAPTPTTEGRNEAALLNRAMPTATTGDGWVAWRGRRAPVLYVLYVCPRTVADPGGGPGPTARRGNGRRTFGWLPRQAATVTKQKQGQASGVKARRGSRGLKDAVGLCLFSSSASHSPPPRRPGGQAHDPPLVSTRRVLFGRNGLQLTC